MQGLEKKKVAFIVTEYNEKVFYGGGEKVNSYIINELLSRGFVIDVFADKSYIEKSKLVNIHIKDSYFEKNYKELLKDYDYILSANLEYASDITYSHNHSYFFEKKLLNTPIFMEKLFSNKSYKKKITKYNNAIKNVGTVSKIVVSSNIQKEDYINNYNVPEEKLYILPPGVDYREKNVKYPENKPFVFGLVARGFDNKGGYITLQAINELKKYSKDFKVRIINKNANKNIFVKLYMKIFGLKKFVEFLPLQDDLTVFYNSIDCLLVPSRKEPFGLIVTEAMSFSKPTIVSSVCGASDLVKDKENGFILDNFSPKKPKLLAEIMLEIMNYSQEQYCKICDNAWKTVKDMSYDEFAKKYIDLLENKA